MSGGRGRSSDSLLLFVAVVVGICLYGPALALALRGSLTSMGAILVPIAGPVLLVFLVVVIARNYWSRW